MADADVRELDQVQEVVAMIARYAQVPGGPEAVAGLLCDPRWVPTTDVHTRYRVRCADLVEAAAAAQPGTADAGPVDWVRRVLAREAAEPAAFEWQQLQQQARQGGAGAHAPVKAVAEQALTLVDLYAAGAILDAEQFAFAGLAAADPEVAAILAADTSAEAGAFWAIVARVVDDPQRAAVLAQEGLGAFRNERNDDGVAACRGALRLDPGQKLAGALMSAHTTRQLPRLLAELTAHGEAAATRADVSRLAAPSPHAPWMQIPDHLVFILEQLSDDRWDIEAHDLVGHPDGNALFGFLRDLERFREKVADARDAASRSVTAEGLGPAVQAAPALEAGYRPNIAATDPPAVEIDAAQLDGPAAAQ
ncbi:hypothetical protein ACWDUL_33750 [Nocardia niigatensis]